MSDIRSRSSASSPAAHQVRGEATGAGHPDTRTRILDYAHSLVRTAWIDPKSKGPYCALFVRHVFHHCNIRLPAAFRPSDWQYSQAYPQGPAFANSLAGEEIGTKIITKNALRPGDLVFYGGTVKPFSNHVITHVALYAGSDQIIDRGSSQVEYRPLSTFAFLVEGRRPHALANAASDADLTSANPAKVSKIMFANGQINAKHRGTAVNHLSVSVNEHGGVVINHQACQTQSFLLELQDQAGRWYKGYRHDGRCTLIGMHVMSCSFNKGLLDVQVDNVAVKPRSLVLTVVEQ